MATSVRRLPPRKKERKKDRSEVASSELLAPSSEFRVPRWRAPRVAELGEVASSEFRVPRWRAPSRSDRKMAKKLFVKYFNTMPLYLIIDSH